MICKLCNAEMLMIYGGGWDYDRLLCCNIKCEYEIELETTTYFENNNAT